MYKPDQDTGFKLNRNFLNHGAYSGLQEDCFGPPEARMWEKTLTHPQYQKEWVQALAEFGFSENITYDEFCKHTGALTRSEYIDYVRKQIFWLNR
ncbi:hypothetical protein D3C75_1104170 [compost metagenome]